MYILELLAQFATNFIAATGLWGVFILMTLESALIPIPSEATMPFAGYLVSQGVLNFWWVVLAGAVGNLIGSLIAYYIGFYLEESILHAAIRKYGRFVLLTMHDYEKAENWFKKHGSAIAFTSRLLPAVRTFISLPAGVAEMNIIKFSIYTFAGSFIWSAFLTYIGVVLGENWHSISGYFHNFDILVVVIFVGLVAFYIWHKREVFSTKKVIDLPPKIDESATQPSPESESPSDK